MYHICLVTGEGHMKSSEVVRGREGEGLSVAGLIHGHGRRENVKVN